MIRVRMHMTERLFLDFNWFHQWHVARMKTLIPFLIGASVLCVALLASSGADQAHILEILCVFALLYGALALLFLVLYLAIRRAAKNNSLIGMESVYTFDEDGVREESSSKLAQGTATCAYGMFRKIYETKDCFYLYISSHQAHVLLKRNIFEGSPDQLHDLLRHKCPTIKYTVIAAKGAAKGAASRATKG